MGEIKKRSKKEVNKEIVMIVKQKREKEKRVGGKKEAKGKR